MQKPVPAHLIAAKRVYRYLKGTPETGLVLGQHNAPGLLSIVVWSDFDYSNSLDDQRLSHVYRTGEWFGDQLGVEAQSTVTTSTCEADTMP